MTDTQEAVRLLREAAAYLEVARVPCLSCGGIGYLASGSGCSRCGSNGFVDLDSAGDAHVALLRRLADRLDHLDRLSKRMDDLGSPAAWAQRVLDAMLKEYDGRILLGEETNDE